MGSGIISLGLYIECTQTGVAKNGHRSGYFAGIANFSDQVDFSRREGLLRAERRRVLLCPTMQNSTSQQTGQYAVLGLEWLIGRYGEGTQRLIEDVKTIEP